MHQSVTLHLLSCMLNRYLYYFFSQRIWVNKKDARALWCSQDSLAARHCGPNQLSSACTVWSLIVGCQPDEAHREVRGGLITRLSTVQATDCTAVPHNHPVSSRGMCCCVFRVSRNLVLEPGKIITQGGNWDIQPVVIKHFRSNIHFEGA